MVFEFVFVMLEISIYAGAWGECNITNNYFMCFLVIVLCV